MKKLLAIATVLSLAVSGAALANTTTKTEPVAPIAAAHHSAKAHHAKVKTEKKVSATKDKSVEKAI
ncbi:acid-shock protein [Providencia alcalifaciens]|uniref:acid-shock protein n=1 Tax=Providencia alcalifaciens TaxID=126385 RepID=UPI0032DB3DDB